MSSEYAVFFSAVPYSVLHTVRTSDRDGNRKNKTFHFSLAIESKIHNSLLEDKLENNKTPTKGITTSINQYKISVSRT
jgi:hypothetical protein